jgi:CheY-like chemotaxis protein
MKQTDPLKTPGETAHLRTSESLNEPGTGRPAPARVLVIEDEALIAALIADVLTESGFRVVGVASTGTEALSIAAEHGADVALVDIKLCGPMDGIEVARLLRQRNDIGTIFISGMDDPDILERARIANPYCYLPKPFLPSQVYKAIDRALKLRSGIE